LLVEDDRRGAYAAAVLAGIGEQLPTSERRRLGLACLYWNAPRVRRLMSHWFTVSPEPIPRITPQDRADTPF
jgi:hypothetical protein